MGSFVSIVGYLISLEIGVIGQTVLDGILFATKCQAAVHLYFLQGELLKPQTYTTDADVEICSGKRFVVESTACIAAQSG